MQITELQLCENHIRFAHRPVWDAARVLSIFTVAPHTKKKLKPEELFPLPWDKDGAATDAEMMKLMEHMSKMGAMIGQKLTQQSTDAVDLQRKDVPDTDKDKNVADFREDSGTSD